MKTARVRAGDRFYDAIIGPKLLSTCGQLVRQIFANGKCAIISDKNVAAHFAEQVERSLKDAGFETRLIIVPPGEQSKTLAQVEIICDELAQNGFDRTSLVVALGGGVIGDLAGFAAAVYHRGIPVMQMPTTLLAQVDSSIGGKTAVNSAAAKNLIGAIHQPALVISDVETLATLPPREFKQGFAEIIKHAIIRDPTLFDALQKFPQDGDLESLVRRNVEIKAEFVVADERDENGRRALLNFGHTIGHAIERAGEYREIFHGEAISLGIVAACNLSVRRAGLSEMERDKVLAALRKFDLPTQLPASIPRDKIAESLPLDKKFERGQVRFVLTPRLGSARLTSDVTLAEIESAVAEL